MIEWTQITVGRFNVWKDRGEFMKKKVLVTGIIAVVLAAVLFLYFRPMPLSDLAEENQTMLITYTEFGVSDGTPSIDYKNYHDITDEQKREIISLMDEYAYTRTFGTVFSDGSLSGLGDKMVNISIYEENDLVHMVSISSTDCISVDDKTYKIKNASEFLDSLSDIVSRPGTS